MRLGSVSMTISYSSVFARNIEATCTATMYIYILFSSILDFSSVVQVVMNSSLLFRICVVQFSKHSCMACRASSLIYQSLLSHFSMTMSLFRSKISMSIASWASFKFSVDDSCWISPIPTLTTFTLFWTAYCMAARPPVSRVSLKSLFFVWLSSVSGLTATTFAIMAT